MNTFNSLTFRWKTSNSTSSNATSVYLITLRTFKTEMRVEEKVLGLVNKFIINYYIDFHENQNTLHTRKVHSFISWCRCLFSTKWLISGQNSVSCKTFILNAAFRCLIYFSQGFYSLSLWIIHETKSNNAQWNMSWKLKVYQSSIHFTFFLLMY